MADEYEPLIDREREPKPRIHEELTGSARERLAEITVSRDRERRETAFRSTMKLVGRSPIVQCFSNKRTNKFKKKNSHREFIYKGDTLHVLTYIEHLYLSYSRYKRNSAKDVRGESGEISEHNTFSDIRKVLITEGLLWEIEWADKGGVIQFRPLASEAMADMDSEIQKLSGDDRWKPTLEPYNSAFKRYLAGDFDELIPKKLYNSVESLLQTICVDLEGWTENEDLPHSDYLQMLNDNGFYDANGITAPELESLLDSLEKLVAKLGNDRKQRHQYIDREYCTLLIHQVGAYLYFLINRYEKFDSK
jgi:hypothetical protein